MNQKTKNLLLNSIGILFLILGLASITNTIANQDLGLAPILWFCYIAMLLLGIGTLKRNNLLIQSQIYIIGIPLIFWNIDFYYRLINGQTLFRIVDYFFLPGPLIGKIISSQHLFSIPLAIYALYLVGKGIDKQAWKIALIEVLAVFLAVRFLTPIEDNINCIFQSCTNFTIPFLPHPIAWFATYTIMIFITHLALRFFFKVPSAPIGASH